MKALIQKRYGSPEVLRLGEIVKPDAGPGQVVLHVKATALNSMDWRLLVLKPAFVRFFAGLVKPKDPIPGSDVAGVVAEVGPGVEGFQVGDRVFGDLAMVGRGGLAEYALAPAGRLTKIPEALSFDQAAALPMAAVTALQALRCAKELKPGMKVLINGASGGVGSFAVQLARIQGAEITAVCGKAKAEKVMALGASRVVDYAAEDVTDSDGRFDLILAVNGYQPLSRYKKIMAEDGALVLIGGSSGRQMISIAMFGKLLSRGGRKVVSLMAQESTEDLDQVAALVVSGDLDPMIDRKFSLNEGVEAFRYLAGGHVAGKVLVCPD